MDILNGRVAPLPFFSFDVTASEPASLLSDWKDFMPKPED